MVNSIVISEIRENKSRSNILISVQRMRSKKKRGKIKYISKKSILSILKPNFSKFMYLFKKRLYLYKKLIMVKFSLSLIFLLHVVLLFGLNSEIKEGRF